MFSKKTVFIVGAGGSKELGLPIGDELKFAIANKSNIAFRDGYSMSSGDRIIHNAIKNYMLQRQERDSNPYWSAGRTIAAAMPQALSIDNFLHTHYDNERIVLMGKLAIAACILDAERGSHIYLDRRTTNRHDFAKSANTWHNTFCKMLTEGVQRKDLHGLFQNVAFITFNYDRCIEHYLALWLEGYMGIPSEEAQDLVRSVTIIHPYGQVGQLPWQNRGIIPVDFGVEATEHNLMEIASHIHTFTEQVADATVQEQAQNIISNAQQVVYLGFSFGRMNMEFLKVNKGHALKAVYGTVMGVSDPNIRMINFEIRENMKTEGQTMVSAPELAKCTSHRLLEDYYRVLAYS